jgi:hypothetical protein
MKGDRRLRVFFAPEVVELCEEELIVRYPLRSAIPNSEWICVVSADRASSVEVNFNGKMRVSAPDIFEFGIVAFG